jgi:hypothetical protein
VVCAEGSRLILATNLTACPSDAPSFASTILGMKEGIGLPKTVLADAGFASAEAVAALEAKGIEPPVKNVGRRGTLWLFGIRTYPRLQRCCLQRAKSSQIRAPVAASRAT